MVTKRKVIFFRIILLFLLSTFLFLALTKSESGKNLVLLFKSKFGEKADLVGRQKITHEEIIEQINNFRVSKKLNSLHRNEKLDKAALARMTVIETSEDFTGELTGVTLENAVKNNGYNYGVVGELEAVNVIPGQDLVEYWSRDTGAVELLSEKGLTDIGISINQNGLGSHVIVILARPLKVSPTPKPRTTASWGGVELWEAVNKRRKELGVNPLSKKEELCTIASIRLNQLLELGKLDGHAGLEPTLNRSDLSWIREKYNLAEFLVTGYPTPEESVKAWENTLGHRDLLAGGQYVWGCIYAQNTFGVAMVAY